MKRGIKYIFYVIGLASVLLFCVSATAGITTATSVVGRTFSEPFNLLLLGVGLIGLGNYLKHSLTD